MVRQDDISAVFPSSGPSTLSELLATRSSLAPASVALGDGGGTCSFLVLQKSSCRLASLLDGLGMGPSTLVAVAAVAGVEAARLHLAAAAAAVCAPLHPDNPPRLQEVFLRSVGADCVVADSRSASLVEAARRLGLPVLEGREVLEDGPATELPWRRSPDDRAVVLSTSGTTGEPKVVPQTQRALLHAARVESELQRLDASDRLLLLARFSHVQGIYETLVALWSGGASICPGVPSPREALRLAVERRVTWIAATPPILRGLLVASRAGASDAPSLRFLRSAGASLSPSLQDDLEDHFAVPVLQGYGLSEALRVASNPLPPGKRRTGTVGPPQACEVGIVDAAGRSLPTGEVGEIVVRGPSVTQGYLAGGAPPGPTTPAGFFPTGDLGRFDADGYLVVLGRRDETLNRGGEMVVPRVIRSCLLEHPRISEAVVLGLPHRGLGEEVGVVCVPRGRGAPSLKELRAHVASSLPASHVPTRWLFLETLPSNPAGKVDRQGLMERLREAPDEKVTEAADENLVQTELAELWRELLDLDRLPRGGDDFLRLGGDSILILELADRIDRIWGLDLSPIHLAQAPRLAAMASTLQRLLLDSGEGARAYRKAGSLSPSLVLLPGVQGMGSRLVPILEGIHPDRPTLLLDFPGLREGELPVDRLSTLADRLLGRIPEDLGPSVLFGLSFGGWVAVAMADRMVLRGLEMPRVVIGDAIAPSLREAARSVLLGTPSSLLPWRRRWRPERLRRALRARWRRWRPSRSRRSFPLVEDRMKALRRASRAAEEGYLPTTPDLDLAVVVTEEREKVTGRPTLGWEELTTRDVAFVRVPGSHFGLLPRHGRALGEAIEKLLG